MTRAVCGDHGVTVGLDWEARLEYRSPERELEFKTRTSSETGTEKPRPLPGAWRRGNREGGVGG